MPSTHAGVTDVSGGSESVTALPTTIDYYDNPPMITSVITNTPPAQETNTQAAPSEVPTAGAALFSIPSILAMGVAFVVAALF